MVCDINSLGERWFWGKPPTSAVGGSPQPPPLPGRCPWVRGTDSLAARACPRPVWPAQRSHLAARNPLLPSPMSGEPSTSGQGWVRGAKQSFAVLVSILTAFAIDAGWDRYSERAEERASLERLLAEFETNLSELELVGTRHRSLHDQGVELLKVGYGLAQPGASSAEQLRRVLGMSIYFDPSTGSLNRFLSDEQPGLIASPELRDRIAGYPAKVDELWQQEQMLRDLIATEIEPYVIENADRLLLLPPATSSDALHELRASLERPEYAEELLASLGDPRLRNLIAARVILEAQSLLKYDNVSEEYHAIVSELRQTIGRPGAS